MNKARKLSEKLKGSGRQPFVTMDYGDVQTVRDDGTLDVTVEGGTLSGIKMTTACAGVKNGDRVVLVTSRNLSTVIGIIAK